MLHDLKVTVRISKMFHKPTSTTVGISVQPLNGAGGYFENFVFAKKAQLCCE